MKYRILKNKAYENESGHDVTYHVGVLQRKNFFFWETIYTTLWVCDTHTPNKLKDKLVEITNKGPDTQVIEEFEYGL